MPACAPSDHVAEHPARHHAQRHHRQDCKTGHGCRLQGAEVDERQADADRHRADIGLDAGPDGKGLAVTVSLRATAPLPVARTAR